MIKKTAGQLAVGVLLVVLLVSCTTGEPATPTPFPSRVPTIPPTQTPERNDIPVYKNFFEGSAEEVLRGISSETNGIGINSEDAAYQSGSQSLEATGTLASPAYSSISIQFHLETLTGEGTVDLSNKTIGFSYFIPIDSPIDSLVLVASSATGQVNLAGVSGTPEQIKGAWHYQQFKIQPIFENSTWLWSDLSEEETREVIRYCSAITIAGMRTSEGEEVPTSFRIDDFKWIGIDNMNAITIDETAASLRNYASAHDLFVSATLFHGAVNDWYSDPWYLYTLAREFNMTTVGGSDPPAEKPADISSIEFEYTDQDVKLVFAEQNGMALWAGTGGWHTNNPRWITDGSYDELKDYLERKIGSDLAHFQGKVLYWSVFNEVVDSDNVSFRNREKKDPTDLLYGTAWSPYGGHYSPYVDGNDISLIEYAFITARAADPEAGLFLTEYSNEEIGTTRSDFIYNFVVDMKNRGIPIDGIGMQLHLMFPKDQHGGGADLENTQAYLDRIDRNVKRYAEAGMFVAFTEFECQIRQDDLSLNTQEGRDEYVRRQQKQAEIYSGIMKIARDNPNVAFINFWAISDQPGTSAYDWSGMEQGSGEFPFLFTDAFLFDKNYEPKTVYDAVLDVLKP